MRYSSVPTSTITAETVTVDGFTRSQKDTSGITTTATRAYTASGMVLTQTDGRSSTSLVQRTYTYDTLGRPLTRSTARKSRLERSSR